MRIIIKYIILILSLNLYSQDVNSDILIIKGTVYDASNNPILNVNLKHNNNGAITDLNGNFEIQLRAKYPINIIVSHVSYKTDTIIIKEKIDAKFFEKNIFLKKNDTFLTDVTLISDKYRLKGVTKIDPKNLQRIPNPTGGIESIIKLLPGISSNNELSSQYSVRGGSFDENLIYVNGIEIYKPFLVRNGEQEG